MSSIKDRYLSFWVSDAVTDLLVQRIDELQTRLEYYTDSVPSSFISIVTNNINHDYNKYIRYLDNILLMYKEINNINLETNNNTLPIYTVAINRLIIYETKILEELN